MNRDPAGRRARRRLSHGSDRDQGCRAVLSGARGVPPVRRHGHATSAGLSDQSARARRAADQRRGHAAHPLHPMLGPALAGDPIYTTTLLPGEKVRLATTDRRSRFSFDSESQLSYRSEQMSEEQYRMSALRAVMSDSSSTDNGSSRNTDQGSWDFHGDASGGIGFFSASADANAHGSHKPPRLLTICASTRRTPRWPTTCPSRPPVRPTRCRSGKCRRERTPRASPRTTSSPLRASSPTRTSATLSPSTSTGSTSARRSSSSWWPSSAASSTRSRRRRSSPTRSEP